MVQLNYLRKEKLPRSHIRIDAQIAAIAIAQNAEEIISHDPHMRTVAQNRIPVIELPDIPEQGRFEFPQ